jgi:hypothetical protein
VWIAAIGGIVAGKRADLRGAIFQITPTEIPAKTGNGMAMSEI